MALEETGSGGRWIRLDSTSEVQVDSSRLPGVDSQVCPQLRTTSKKRPVCSSTVSMLVPRHFGMLSKPAAPSVSKFQIVTLRLIAIVSPLCVNWRCLGLVDIKISGAPIVLKWRPYCQCTVYSRYRWFLFRPESKLHAAYRLQRRLATDSENDSEPDERQLIYVFFEESVRTEGRKEGRTDGPMDGRTDEATNRRTDTQSNGRANGRTNVERVFCILC